jgi:hypothetical protein
MIDTGTEKRIDKFACKNCGGSGHSAKECPEPLNMDNVECKECNEKRHCECLIAASKHH